MVYLIINWVLSAMSLLGVTIFVPGFRIGDFASALIAAGIVGLISSILSLGLRHIGAAGVAIVGPLLFIFDTFLFRVAGLVIPGFAMLGFVPAISGAVALMAVHLVTLRYEASIREDYDWDSAPAQPSSDTAAEFAPTTLVSDHR
jgi:putative membrane protein